MTRLLWGLDDNKVSELGVSRGVVYPAHYPIEIWAGLTAVNEAPEGDSTPYYANGEKRFDKETLENFAASVEAFVYPEVIDKEKAIFLGFTYRTELTNGRYKLHLVYNPKFVVSDYQYTSIDEAIEPSVFVWNLVTKPVDIYGYAPTAHLILESNQDFSSTMRSIEDILYGTDVSEPYWPEPNVVLDIINNSGQADTLLIIDHGNGMWTAVGPDNIVRFLDDTTFEIESPTVDYINDVTYRVSSF